MITGAHILLYSENPEADRAFFRDILEFDSVDAGEGWLIFALPPAELALHPIDGDTQPLLHAGRHLLGASFYLMCPNLRSYIELLKTKHVRCTEIEEEPWGIRTTIVLPSGGEFGLYQPKHASPLALSLEKE